MVGKKVRINDDTGSSYDGQVGTITEIIGTRSYAVLFSSGEELPFTVDEVTIVK